MTNAFLRGKTKCFTLAKSDLNPAQPELQVVTRRVKRDPVYTV